MPTKVAADIEMISTFKAGLLTRPCNADVAPKRLLISRTPSIPKLSTLAEHHSQVFTCRTDHYDGTMEGMVDVELGTVAFKLAQIARFGRAKAWPRGITSTTLP